MLRTPASSFRVGALPLAARTLENIEAMARADARALPQGDEATIQRDLDASRPHGRKSSFSSGAFEGVG